MTDKSELRALRDELRYYQTMVRVDIRALKAGIRKCHEIGAKMRALQPKPVRELRPDGWRPQTVTENEARQSELL